MVNVLDAVNINYLTSLWKLMGTESFTFPDASKQLYLAKAWPRRCWLQTQGLAAQLEATVLEKFLSSLSPHTIVPIWDYPYKNALGLEQGVIDQGMAISFTQTAMYLDIRESINAFSNHSLDVKVSKLTTDMNSDIQIWITTASEAFGYIIDPLVIQSIVENPNIHLLLAKVDGEAVATAMLFRGGDGLDASESIFGVHQMGVPARHAGQGFAGFVMNYIINYCRQLGGRYLTLQASVAGEGIYRRIGFVSQFGIRNYMFET